jgi:hypothetical protein
MTEEKRTAGSRGLSSATELYDVYDNCDSDEKWIQEDEVSGDSGDRVTGETDSEIISSSTVNRDDQVTETDKKSADECQDNVAPDTSENDSGDSSDDTVTVDSRCENNCQPVNHCQPAAENNKKPVQNCGGNRKKHGKKSKKKKGGKKH